MTNFDQKYKEMVSRCEEYVEKETYLRYQMYGYHNSLDLVVPYAQPYNYVSSRNSCIGLQNFIKQILYYYEGFSKETGQCFELEFSEQTKNCVEAMVKCIVYYLKEECNKDDYTFLGMIKLVKTFLEPTEFDDEEKNKENNIFWILYSDIKEKVEIEYSEEIKDAFGILFDNFNAQYMCNVADGLYYCIRFFLYDFKIDYVSDDIMLRIADDMIEEISDRMHNIKFNRTPRRFRR